MARKNPLTKITDLAADALKNPRETAEKAVDQVKETSAVARSLATRAAARASDTASALAHHTRASRHRGSSDPTPTSKASPATPPATKAAPSTPQPAAPRSAGPQPAAESRKIAGDPVKPPAKRTAPKTSAAKKSPTKKAGAKKPAAKKQAARKPGPTTPHHEPTPADVARNIAPHPPTEEPPSTPGDKLPPRKPAQAKP